MKFIRNLLVMVSILFMLWCGTSYCEILWKHHKPNPNYNENNIIIKVVEWVSEYYNYEN